MSDLTANDNPIPSVETTNGSSLEDAKNTVVNSKVSESSAFFTISQISIADVLKQKIQAPELLTAQLTSSLDASAAANAVKNHPITQSVTNGILSSFWKTLLG